MMMDQRQIVMVVFIYKEKERERERQFLFSLVRFSSECRRNFITIDKKENF